MKKVWLFLIIVIIFVSLFLMPMAWGMGELDADDIAELQEQVKTAQYKDDLCIPACDRMILMRAPADSDAGRVYAALLEKFEELPLRRNLNWAEKFYHEHELQKKTK